MTAVTLGVAAVFALVGVLALRVFGNDAIDVPSVVRLAVDVGAGGGVRVGGGTGVARAQGTRGMTRRATSDS